MTSPQQSIVTRPSIIPHDPLPPPPPGPSAMPTPPLSVLCVQLQPHLDRLKPTSVCAAASTVVVMVMVLL